MLQKSKQRGPSLKDLIEVFDEETVLVKNPTFLREAITIKKSLMIQETREAIE